MLKKRILELTMAMLLLTGVFFLSREGARMVATQTEDKKVVVLDAGHGAVDPGKVGVNNVIEKDVNLKIVLKLKKILEDEGVLVVLTRKDDTALYSENAQNKKVEDMQSRVKTINGNAPDCAISIHQNSYSQESVKGPQVFYYQHSKEGKILGGIIQKNLSEQVSKGNKREAKGNVTYFLLKKTEVPLAIVECGFLSNAEEAALLATDEYQSELATSVGASVMEYLGTK